LLAAVVERMKRRAPARIRQDAAHRRDVARLPAQVAANLDLEGDRHSDLEEDHRAGDDLRCHQALAANSVHASVPASSTHAIPPPTTRTAIQVAAAGISRPRTHLSPPLAGSAAGQPRPA
jgi:hypothetical protein